MAIHTRFSLLKYRRSKIVATLGPSTASVERIVAMIESGVNVFRFNFSHGSHEEHAERYRRVHEAMEQTGQRVAILADLSGPKIRVGQFNGGSIELAEGSTVTVTVRDVMGEVGLIPSQYRELADDVVRGDRILLDDGNLELKVRAVEGTEIAADVIVGGLLKDRKGMNLPGVEVSAPSLTEKDRADAVFAMGLGIGILALSFVRREEDVRALRELADGEGCDPSIIAKIEKPEALENIDGILAASDGIMIARGDLGVELPPQAVPVAQEQLIALARRSRKPVIVATQMLESMMGNPRPTRAEASDVAHAVRSGADAVMLSGETAAGEYPLEAVRMMDLIARQTEAHLWSEGAFQRLFQLNQDDDAIPFEDAISEATSLLSRELRVRGIVVLSRQGRSIAVMSSSRPAAPLIGVTMGAKTCDLSNLMWGVLPHMIGEDSAEDELVLARRLAEQFDLAVPGQAILLVRGFSRDEACNTPSVTALRV